MNLRVALGFLFLSASFIVARCVDRPSRASLLREIRNNEIYREIPDGKDGNPLNVKFALYPINIADADPMKKEVEMDAWLRLEWDSGITWPSTSGIESLSVPIDYMWLPDISVFNGVNQLTNNAPDYTMVTNEGRALYMPNVKVRSLCDVDPHKLAYNVTCSLEFGMWVNSDSVISFVELDNDVVRLIYYFQDGRFQILQASAIRVENRFHLSGGDPIRYATINVDFSFKENNPSHHHGGCAQGYFTCR